MSNLDDPVNSIHRKHQRQFEGNSCAGAGVFIFSSDCTILSCNDIFLNWLGLSFQGVVGQKIIVSLPEIALPFVPVGNVFREVMTPLCARADLCLIAADGREIAPIVSLDVLPMNQDCLLLVVVNCNTTNYTSKRTLEDLMLEAMLSKEAIAVTDACGQLEFANDAFEAMTGFCQGEIIGKRWEEWLPELESVQTQPHWLPDIDGKNKRSRVSKHYKKNGESLYLFQSVRWFVDNGDIPSHIVFEAIEIDPTDFSSSSSRSSK